MKYGPTAIIVLVGAFWARVTYQAKLAQPWIDLAKGSHKASRTVLADYISLWEPRALAKSISCRHYLVAIAILCGLLLKALTVVSTALIFGELIPILRTNTEFTASSFRNDPANLNNVGTVPYLAIASALNRNVSWPRGTSEGYAFQTFNASTVPYSSRLQAQVDVFNGTLECDLANNSFANWTVFTGYDPEPQSRYFTSEMDFTTHECLIRLRNETVFDISIYAHDDLNTTIWRWTKFQPTYCGNSADADNGRLLISVGELAARHEAEIITPIYMENVPNGSVFGGSAKLDVTRCTTLICKPLYDIAKLSVTLNVDSNTENVTTTFISDADTATSHRALDRVHAWDIAQSLDTALTAAISPGNEGFPQPYADTDKMAVELALRIGMRLRSSSNTTQDELFDKTILSETTKRLYHTFTAQIAHTALIDHNPSTIIGNATVNEYRLVVQPTPVYTMSTMLGLMALLTLFAAFLSPKIALAPLNPSTVPGFAPIAVESGGMMSLLGRSKSVKFTQIDDLLSSALYWSTASQMAGKLPFSIEAQQQTVEGEPPSRRSLQFKWFQPLVLQSYIHLLVCVLVLVIMVALELLLYYSHRNNGLCSLTQSSNLKYVWTYVPAVTMVLLSIYFTGVDVYTKTFAPYHRLRQGCDWQTIRYNLVDRISICAASDAVRTSNWAVLMTTCAGILGSFLAVIVNDVYRTEIQSSVTKVQVQVDSWFPFNNDDQWKDSGAMTAGLILNANSSYPSWTYDNLALASISIQPNSTIDGNAFFTNTSTLVTKIPAIRPKYECRVYSDGEVIVNYTSGLTLVGDKNLTNPLFVAAIPELCYDFQPTNDTYWWSSWSDLFLSTSPNSPFGMLSHRYPACSDNIFVWGQMGATGVESLSVAACNSTNSKVPFDQLLVEVTLLGPNMQIDESNPPRPDESTAQSLNNADLRYMSEDVLGDLTPTDNLDTFFSALVYGRYGLPVEILGNRSNDGVVMESVYRQMQIIQAQQAAAYWRKPTNATIMIASYPGTLSNMNRTVLIQNAIPTHSLVALLAVMLILTFISRLLMDTRYVLPFEPTTIGAIASLLTHSNILDKNTLLELDSKNTSVSQEKPSREPRWMVKLGWFDDQGKTLEISSKDRSNSGQFAHNAVFTINALNQRSLQQSHDVSNLRSSIYNRICKAIDEISVKKTSPVTEEEVYDSLIDRYREAR